MTKQEAIYELSNIFAFGFYNDRVDEAVNMAIEALEQERSEIIRCENCRHDSNCEIQYSAQAGSKFFCGSAERREE